ncbi:MAG: hypothetical protein JWO86_44 [Myxococcaceae bacterium]|nr:hypothetical protein [Myxococcaceae bacterium]
MSNKIVFAVGTLVVATLGAISVGCGGAHLSALREAAEADLNCPKSRVHILNSGKTRDVEACGQRATYHYEDGDWRMIARSGAPGPAAAGAGGQPVMKAAPGVAPAQPAPVMTPTSTPSQPPGTPSQPPPSSPAPGGKSL